MYGKTNLNCYMKFLSICLILLFTLRNEVFPQTVKINPGNPVRVKVAGGILEGAIEAGGVQSFKGVPYAKPPVGELRWKDPQPLPAWKGIYVARKFGPRSFQNKTYSDMIFRSEKMSEDCLYLNVWVPAGAKRGSFPVLVYFHGGGFVCGDGSELRYDGESMARKGIITVTVNYRLGVFGFFSHPELSKESNHHSSGNYGLLDQSAALKWVNENIKAFGGDPARVTIAGQSAGSISVSAQMASPLSKGLFSAAIGQSGSILGSITPISLSEAEQNGMKITRMARAGSLEELRKIPATALFGVSTQEDAPYGRPVIDGYFFPETPLKVYSTGKQADIPLLAGWTSAEIGYSGILGKDEPTVENFKKAVQRLYGEHSGEILAVYRAEKNEDVAQVATELGSDRFIVYSTWKWLDIHGKTNGHPVYRYLYSHPFPLNESDNNNSKAVFRGAPHSADIAYALGNLAVFPIFKWTSDDYKVSETMQSFFVNFIKTGNPNGEGLPVWYGLQSSIPKVMVFDNPAKSEPEKNQKRYLLLDQLNDK